MWRYLDKLHPALWREGQQFPNTASAMTQMLADGELLVSLTFNPNEAANEIASKRLPESVQSWQFKAGTIGNTHFVAIPFNAPSRAGAASLPISSCRQRHKREKPTSTCGVTPPCWRYRACQRHNGHLFQGGEAGQLTQAAPVLPEPHASWVDKIEKEWIRRYAR